MTLRTRMLLAFVALAVVPMVAIVVGSYTSSIAAFREAVAQEGEATAREMNRKVGDVAAQLDATLSAAARLGPGADELESETWFDRLSAGVRPVAPLLEAAEFVPSRELPAPAALPAPPAGAAPREGDGEASSGSGLVFFFRGGAEPEPPDAPPPTTDDEEAARAREAAAAAQVEASRAIESLVALGSQLARDYREDPEGFQQRMASEGSKLAERIEGLDGIAEQGAKIAIRSVLESEETRAVLEESARAVEEARRELLASIPERLRLTREEQRLLDERRRESERLLGRHFRYEVRDGEQVVGHLEAGVRAEEVIRSVLGEVERAAGEIPFAVDRDGRRYTLDADDEATLARLDGDPDARTGWVVVEKRDQDAGVSFGIARPVGERLEAIRRTAIRNLTFGLGLLGVAAVAMVPLSRRMTRRLGEVTEAAGALATGDLSVRVPEGAADEVGRLARAFNRMAADLGAHQRRILEEQQRRQEDDVARRLLEADHARKSNELEEARRFQLSLLPEALPDHEAFEIAVAMRTATEVGGDYYDVHGSGRGPLTVVVGDATGHGAAAGTMVTVAKSLFSASAEPRPAVFLEEAATAVRRMGLERMCMALQVVRFEGDGLVLASAGMPPAMVWRRDRAEVEEVLVPGLPVGAARAGGYVERRVRLAPGDVVLLMSDGFPELPDATGEPLGYERARRAFAAAAGVPPEEVIRRLLATADGWRGPAMPPDDITFLVVRVRERR